MPITEAMASGAPVVASSHPSLDDACGDAAVRADPESAEAIAAGDPRGARTARRPARARARARCERSRGSGPARSSSRGTTDSRRHRHDAAPADAGRHGALPARAAGPPRRPVERDLLPGHLPASDGRRGRLLVPAAAPGGVDVLHCPTFRGPFAAEGAARRHGARPGRAAASGVVQPLDADLLALAVPRWSPRPTALIAVSEFTKRELIELLGVPEAKIRVVPNAVEDVFTPEGPRAEGDYVLAVGTLEPRKNLERIAAAVDGELRVVGARGWGGVEPPANVVWLGEVGDDELARSTAAPAASSTRRSTRGSGSRSPRRLPAAARSSRAATAPMAEIAGADATYVDPTDVDVDPRGHRSSLRSVRPPRCVLGRRGARPRASLRGARVILLDADVLGRERTGDETYVTNLLRELPARRARPAVRGGDAASGARSGGRRADRSSLRASGAQDGVVAPTAPAPARARARPLPARPAARLARPRRS